MTVFLQKVGNVDSKNELPIIGELLNPLIVGNCISIMYEDAELMDQYSRGVNQLVTSPIINIKELQDGSMMVETKNSNYIVKYL